MYFRFTLQRSICHCLTLAGWLVGAHAASAAVTLPAVISDHMVLQRDRPAPVWWWAAPGETVTVEFAGQRQRAVADATGRWEVTLPAMSAEAAGRPLTITAGEAPPKVLTDVLVGEVWLCSGQSNMQFPLEKCSTAATDIPAANRPQVRLYTGKPVVALAPATTSAGAWAVCEPATAGKFSAVAYLFGRELHERLGVPVGLIHVSEGWTPAEAWLSRDALLADPDLAYIVRRWDEVTAAAERAKAENQKPDFDPMFIHRAAGLWNGSIVPLAPYAVRGVIWYQGETNDQRGYQYRKLFPALINDWRRAWREPALPFLYVQLANVLPPDPAPVESEWAEVREAQLMTLALTNTGMAITIDIGEEKDVHPKNKQDVAHRLALVARAQVYGEAVEFSGPRYRAHTVEGGAIRLQFDRVAGGLTTRGKEPLRGFAIAGADRKFVAAEAAIEGETVVVRSPQIAAPVAVRYAWANNPAGCNLENAAGLPASPFRTDDWPGKSAGNTKLFIDR